MTATESVVFSRRYAAVNALLHITRELTGGTPARFSWLASALLLRPAIRAITSTLGALAAWSRQNRTTGMNGVGTRRCKA